MDGANNNGCMVCLAVQILVLGHVFECLSLGPSCAVAEQFLKAPS